MKKILSGVMGIVTTGAVVTAAAYALFSAQATVSGINFSTSNLELTVSKDGSTFTNALDADLDITNAYPGFGEDNSVHAPIYIRNESDGATLDLSAQLTAATGWNDNVLKNYVEVAVVEDGGTIENEDYKTLAAWNANPQDLPGDNLDPDETQEYEVYVRLPSTAPDALQGKSLTNITFTITGEQVAPSAEPL